MPTWAIGIESVKRAIGVLTSQLVHPFFPAYLLIRKEAVEKNVSAGLQPRWDEMGSFLEMPGGPPKKPYFRPLFTKVSDPSRYWMGTNLAGMWSPSSLREGQPPREVVSTAGRGANATFSLKPDHAALAFQHLLFETPVDVYALAIFLYRDFGFTADPMNPDSAPTAVDVFNAFMNDFKFAGTANERPAHPDFGKLFFTAEREWSARGILEPFAVDTTPQDDEVLRVR